MTNKIPDPPYRKIISSWWKLQAGVVVAFIFLYLGSLVLAPNWDTSWRMVATLVVPIIVDVVVSAVFLWIALGIWRAHSRLKNERSG